MTIQPQSFKREREFSLFSSHIPANISIAIGPFRTSSTSRSLPASSFSGSASDPNFVTPASKRSKSWVRLFTKRVFRRSNKVASSRHSNSLPISTATESCSSATSSVGSTTSNENLGSYHQPSASLFQPITAPKKRSKDLFFKNSHSDHSQHNSNHSSDSESGPNRKGFFERMVELKRNHTMPVSSGNVGTSRLSNNTLSLPAITLNRSTSDNSCTNDISRLDVSPPMSRAGAQSSMPAVSAYILNASLESVISAIHSGNFLQLSDANLDMLIRALAGRDSKVLESIKIKSAAISSTDARLLAKLIKSSDAANIKTLKLDNNAISQDAFKHLFEGLKVNKTITEFSMARSGVNDKSVKYIAKAMAENVALKSLDLSNNRITAQGTDVLCKALTYNQCLKRLCLQSNNIKAAGAPHLAALLLKNRIIRHINIGSNGLGSDGCIMIADAVRFNRNLISLSMDMNEMGPRGASAMALVVASNRHLNYLYIPHNNIGDEGLAEISTSLKRNNSLIGLDLELNHIGNGQNVLGMKALSEALAVNTCLREINLSYNLFSSEAIQELMGGVAANSTLESILFSNCCITTEGALAIAKILPSATGIQNLGLTSNPDIAVEAYWALATSLDKNFSMKGIQLDYNSVDRHSLYESIQQSLTRNFLWQQEVYRSICHILTLSRVVLLGRPSEQKLLLSQQLQQQQQQSGAGWNILKRVGLGRTFSANSQASLLSFRKKRPGDLVLSNGTDGGSNQAKARDGVENFAQGNNSSRSSSLRGSSIKSGPANISPLLRQISNSVSPQLYSGNTLQLPQQHQVQYKLQSPQSTPSPQQQQLLYYNAHSVMAHLGNMPYEIFEAICAFLDPNGNMSITQIRATIRVGGDRSTLSAHYTKANMLEQILQSRYIPSVGVRYGVKNGEERI
ncbi:hypothetical protein BGX27_003357 [Mortierella sp. AM989]|nr:hypothetical protein BGX27_003357 [Mortierella sp. AM989]